MESLFLRIAPQALLLLYVSKLLVSGATVADSIIVAFLAALCGINQYIKDNKFKQELQEQFDKLDKKDQELHELMLYQKEKIEELRTHASTVKLTSHLRAK